jgi:hypothetical protein
MTSILTAFLLMLLTSQSLWADVRASLSRQTIYKGDTVTLTIMTDGTGQGADPDLSVLQQDFDIVGTGSSQQTQIINGQRSERHQWRIELAPKRGGELSVPPIKVGAGTTAPLTLTITPQPEAALAQAGQPVFIKAQLTPADTTLYVQQQIHYTLQLFYRERLYEGSLDEPQVEHALVERLGDDVQYQTTMNGREYQVLERHYAIFPEQSGPLSIPPATFNGRLAGAAQPRHQSMFMNDMMERFFGNNPITTPGKRIRLRSEGFTLEVQPRPAAYTGKYWLPAKALSLTDSWASSPPEFHSGVPVTRTITLTAEGLESTHLPDISLEDTASMRLYPEKPINTNRTDGERVIGSRQLSVAYVPATTGMQTIPALSIDWWDTTTETQKTAVLPAWTINVLPGDGMADAQSAPPSVPATGSAAQPADESEVPMATPDSPDWLAAARARWTWWAGGLLFLVTGLFVARRYKDRGASSAPRPVEQPGRKQLATARLAVQQACQSNDPAAAARALLQWAAASWPDDPPASLGALAQRLSTGVEELQALERALYGATGEAWQGDALWREFDQGLQQQPDTTSQVAPEGLSPLYPDWKT